MNREVTSQREPFWPIVAGLVLLAAFFGVTGAHVACRLHDHGTAAYTAPEHVEPTFPRCPPDSFLSFDNGGEAHCAAVTFRAGGGCTLQTDYLPSSPRIRYEAGPPRLAAWPPTRTETLYVTGSMGAKE